MKKIYFICSVGIFSYAGLLGQQIVKSNIEKVTVYLSGAQVTRTAKVMLKEGGNTLIFKDLPATLDKDNIQVMATGGNDVLIVSVMHHLDYLNSQGNTAGIAQLLKRKNKIEDSITLLKNSLQILESEKEMLMANKAIGGKNTGVNLNELKQIANFFRERLTEIERQRYFYNKNKDTLLQILKDITNQLQEYTTKSPTSNVQIICNSKKNISSEITLQYVVGNVLWQPFYDIRVQDIASPIQLSYKAKVQQYTGEDWNNAILTFSTADPTINNNKPILDPIYINFKEHNIVKFSSVRKVYSIGEAHTPPTESSDLLVSSSAPMHPATSMSRYVEYNTNETNLEMKVNIPYSVPSDNKWYDVAMAEYSIPVVYQYACVPNKSKYAYLLAKITNWSDYHLLEGDANIFFNGVYQGNSHLHATTKDTLNLSIGRDNAIVIERKELKNFSDQKWIGSTKKQQKIFEINIRNNKKIEVPITVEDQYPVSRNNDIQITDLDIPNGMDDKNTGIVIWNVHLKPNTMHTIRWGYSIKYPKDKDIIIQ